MRLLYTYFIIAISVCLLAFTSEVNAQQSGGRAITGIVTDENNDPLPGAGVTTPDGKRGTVTDINGKYSIDLQEGDAVLSFSFLSYATQDIVIGKRNKIDVQLLPDKNNVLNDVVVIGYGTAKKADLTGSVATVKIQDIQENPSLSVDHALQGRIAGVDIMSTDGTPGASTSIRIRGSRSIKASNEPLIVVDGVMDAVNDLADIASSDIQSISVLKDASSTAIYGSRGANGVILVTTKQGATAKPSVTANVKFGISQLARDLDLMNKDEFLRYRNDYIYINDYIDGKAPSAPRYDPADYTTDTDWLDEITRLAYYQSYSVSVSGKAKGSNYYGAMSYVDEQGIVEGSGVSRINARLNLSKSFTDWLSVALKLSASYRMQDLNKATISGSSYGSGALYLSPLIETDATTNPLYETAASFVTPVSNIKYQEHKRNTLSQNDVIEFTLKPIKGLVIKSQNSLFLTQRHDYRFWPSTIPGRLEEEGADAYRYEGDNTVLSTENTITYKSRVARHHTIDALLGYSASRTRNNYLSVRADGLVSDDIKWNNMNAIGSKENYTVTGSTRKVVRQSVFGRLNYGYRSKYYLTVTMRADGCSNFAANNKWGFFPSAAFKWNIKGENFMKKAGWINDLALRLSAGRSGNDALDPYKSLAAYSTTTSGYPFDGSQGVNFYPVRVANPDLTWETTDLYNAAVDMAFLKNRLMVTLEGYYAKTTDLLMTLTTISSTGYTSRYGNLGSTSNLGAELTIESRNIERRKFGWSTVLTMSHNSQMVRDIGKESFQATVEGKSGYMMYGYKAGYPLNALWGFQYAGVWHSAAEWQRNQITKTYLTEANGAATSVGKPKYVDQDGDGVMTQNDLIYMGQADPYLYGGLQNSFNIGDFKLSVYLNYSLGGKIYNYQEQWMSGSYRTNQYRKMADAWHPVRNPESDIPRAGAYDRMLPSDLIIYDASFLRLKEVTASYTFDVKKHLKWIRRITLSVTGDNLWVWTKYPGFDPDVSTQGEDVVARRVDIDAYPKARKIIFTLGLKF